MPRKKQNVDAYGKSWSPIDIPNLEKAIKLYERLNYLQDHFADSLSGSHNIMSQINEKTDIQNELQELGIKLTEDQAKKVIESLKLRQRENELLDKSNRSTSGVLVGNLNSNPYEKTTSYNKPNVDIYKQDSLRGYLNNAGSIYSTSKQNRLYNQAVNIEAEKLKAAGSIMSNEGLRKTAEINIKNGKMSNEASRLLDKSAQGFTKGASVIQIAADTLLAGVNKLTSLFFEGANKQKQIYEDTFTNISVRNRTTRSQYYSAQSELNNTLEEQNLFNNIGSSEIMQMWNTLASQGIAVDMSSEKERAELNAKAIDTVLTNKIVPYLDTSDAYFQQLVNIQPQLMKQVRGIGLLNQELVGSNVIANKYLQDMITNLSPISRFSSQQLGLQYAKSTNMYEKLREKGISDYSIGQFYGSVENTINDAGAALTSGNLDQVLAVSNLLTSGGDLSDVSEVTASLLNSANFVSNLTGEYGKGKFGTLFQGDLGVQKSFSAKAAYELANSGIDMASLTNEALSITEEDLNNVAKNATNDFSNDINQTNKKLQELTMENISNEFAVLQEFMGHWYDVLTTAVKGIATILTTGIIAKGIGGLVGSSFGGSGAGILSALGSGGGIALGAIGGVAAGLALANAVHEGVMKAAAEENEKDKKKQDMKTRGLAEDLGISEDEANILTAGSNIYNSDENWLGVKFDSNEAASLFGAKLGIFDTLDEKDFIQTMDKSTEESDTLSYNKAKIGRSLLYKGIGTGPTVLSNIAQAWLIGLYSQGYTGKNATILQALSETLGLNVTPDEDTMRTIMSGSTAMSRSQFNNTVKLMTDADMWLWNENGKWIMPNESDYDKVLAIKDIPTEKVEFLGSHRLGLNKVPYDNYPALLHENETVLTASTADELRNLIATYRETSQQSISFDAIIQTQTTTLCAKLDQVIESINNTNSSNIKPSWDTNSTLNNMKNLRNLNSFNN